MSPYAPASSCAPFAPTDKTSPTWCRARPRINIGRLPPNHFALQASRRPRWQAACSQRRVRNRPRSERWRAVCFRRSRACAAPSTQTGCGRMRRMPWGGCPTALFPSLCPILTIIVVVCCCGAAPTASRSAAVELASFTPTIVTHPRCVRVGSVPLL